jgi:hypothetical protein
MSILNPNWKYVSAQDSAKPGYLSRRMALYRYRIQKEVEAAAEAAKKSQGNVTKLKGAK